MRTLVPLLALVFSFNLMAKTAPKKEAAAKSEPVQYQIDTAHGSLDFSIRHMMISNTKGRFNKWDGSFMFDKATGELKDVKVNVDVASIDTKEPKRDEHLKGADFFDVAKYPTMTFVSTKVDLKNKKPVKLTGDLTLHGVTKPVTLNIEYLGSIKTFQGTEAVGFKGTGTINRKDFGLVYNKVLETGGLALGEEVSISFDFEGGPTNK